MIENRVEGKVARILNERDLVINRGSQDGVKPGMRFAILAEEPTPIIDPDSGENLGSIYQEKVRVEAIEVDEHFTVCSTYETITVGGAFPRLNADLLFAPPRTVREKLRVAEFLDPLSAEQRYIKVGDRIREIIARS